MPVVVLSRADNSTPWGFRLQGGKDFGAPLTVQRINPGSVAAKCGLLIGDVIAKIDSTMATDLKHKDAQDLIAKGGNNIQLTINRGQEFTPQMTPQSTDMMNNKLTTSSTMSYEPKQYGSQQSSTMSYEPKQYGVQPTYGRQIDQLTDDTASLEISKKYDLDERPKWEAPFLRGVTVPPTAGYNPGNETKKYFPSETARLVRDMEAGNEVTYNPRTGAELRPAPVQSKLVDILEKKCGDSSPQSMPPPPPPSSNWSSPSSGARPMPPAASYGSRTQTGASTGISPSGYHAPGSSAAKPSGFKSGSSLNTDRRPSQDAKKMTHLEEALSMPAYSGGNIPICNVDNQPIKGPYITAVNKTWCQEHFVCSNPSCRRSLADTGFIEDNGQLYCKDDYEQYLAPRCVRCDQPIIGDTVKALQKTYHPQCFFCAHCKQPIMGGLFHLQQGEPYCEKDWAALFQSKCFGCNFPIEMGDTWIEALGQNWHAECFNCTTCHVNLESQGFVNRGGRPYCREHARV